MKTYRAMQVTRPGVLELVERTVPSPSLGEVLIQVEACGICGADVSYIENPNHSLPSPRVPGHEVVGRINALGNGVPSMWQVGQRVGVGRLGGHCNDCSQCRQGNFQLCQDQPVVGVTTDGGYAEVMLVRATGLVSIPDELSSIEAAPILCAGIATFNALKKCSAQAGDTVAIVGIGGLGHMAIQYANRMGYRVIAIGRGDGIEVDARKLGAHDYIDSTDTDVAKQLNNLGGAHAIISTIGDAHFLSTLLGGLAPQGTVMVLGVTKDPLAISTGNIISGERRIEGSITGTPVENEKALKFSVLTQAKPMIEVMPLEHANEAYQRMRSGEVKFRMVLKVG